MKISTMTCGYPEHKHDMGPHAMNLSENFELSIAGQKENEIENTFI